MTIEAKLKQIIGEQTFAVVALQTRLEELTAENERLQALTADKPEDKHEPKKR